MSDKVVSIGEIKKESGPNVISIIEDILESAYKGGGAERPDCNCEKRWMCLASLGKWIASIHHDRTA